LSNVTQQHLVTLSVRYAIIQSREATFGECAPISMDSMKTA